MSFYLITNCTNNKSSKAEKKLLFSDFISKRNVVDEWLNSLNDKHATIKAIDMYVGDHWKNVRKINQSGVPVSIVSAGYGLISSDKHIHSYDATFSSNNKSSVNQIFNSKRLTDRNIEWWQSIHKSAQRLSPVKSLIEQNDGSFFVISLAPDYLRVIEPELIHLAEQNIINADNTVIISGDVKLNSSLNSLYIKNSEDFCKELGGSRISLNIRLTKYLMENIDTTSSIANQINSRYKDLISVSEPAQKFKRTKLSDEELIDFIKDEMMDLTNLKVSASMLLRQLRNKGLACEQKRFSKLYKSLK